MRGGGLLETTGRPANLMASGEGDPSLTLPGAQQPSPLQCPCMHSKSFTSMQFASALLCFSVSKDNFCWALNPMYYSASFNVLVIKS